MNEDKSWLESCWEQWLEDNKDNPNWHVQRTAESVRKVMYKQEPPAFIVMRLSDPEIDYVCEAPEA